MFIRNHLAVVSHWAKDQLADGAATPEQTEHLRRLIEAADALRADMPDMPTNVLVMERARHAH
ncbi:hypothetical protein [Terricaulis sp.]|uniref:hypothetical protein n=1 Tax=Terricaulis sp. TaxID=2768686 RepID=UPI002AC75368|nr:hypothetical protein [Terricaulis sp.]MDZ4691758.1 hypothetical protein [Terricaulis sp.]